jgi:hypothetical protein
VIALPNATPAPLRPSRKPLPGRAINAQTFAKAPPASFYAAYLENLAGPDPSPSSNSLWQNYVDATSSPIQIDDHKALKPGGPYASGSEQGFLDTTGIPTLFFRDDFDLGNPLIWESLTRGLEAQAAPADDAAVVHMLSDQLDVLETHLVREVSQRAPMFFSALANLQHLTSESAICLEQITSLQATLSDLDNRVPLHGLLVAETQHDLDQCRRVTSGLAAIQGAVDSVYLARQLSQNQDWTGALDALTEFQQWCSRHNGTETAINQQTSAAQRKPHTRGANSSLPALSEISEDMNGDIPAIVRAASRERLTPLALASLSSIQDVISSLKPMIDSMRSEIKVSLSQHFNSAIESQAARLEGNRGMTPDTPMPISLAQPIFRAFVRCGGSVGDIVGLWRIACLKVVREGMRKVGSCKRCPFASYLTSRCESSTCSSKTFCPKMTLMSLWK